VPVSSYVIFFSAVTLELALAWRLAKGKLWSKYPLFAFYVAYVITQGVLGFALLRYAPSVYPTWYWRSGIANILLRFLLIWEVFRHTFPQTSPLRRLVSRQAFVEVSALIIVLTGMLWAVETYGKSHSVYLAMERSFGFVQAALILAVLSLARYYHVRVGRNLWGISIAFGMYCSIATVASAIVDLVRSTFFPLKYLLTPLSFVAMLAMWTWAMWDYAPNPPLADSTLMDPALESGQWSENWGRAVSTIRKVSNP
jgi:hypothetical protein